MDVVQDGLSPADFAATAERAVAACAGLDLRDQAARLAGDGLLGVLADPEVGGLGLSLPFAVPVATAAQAGLLAFPLAEGVLVALHAGTAREAAQAVVEGAAVATVAWRGQVQGASRGNAVALSGTVGAAPAASRSDFLLVRVDHDRAALVEVRAPGVTVEEPSGIDLAIPDYTVRLDGVSIAKDLVLATGSWRALSADAGILRAAAVMGSAERCLALACEHAAQRRQFGHALCYNQAIRHSLARHKLVLEGMRHSIERCLALGANAGEMQREAVFLAATAGGVTVAEGALQVFGAMGFTWDMPLHRHIRRIRSLAAQGPDGGLAALGRQLVAEVPAARQA
jgi:alkylation response protein AidB-like acyl-CoA dehydrogenase